MKLSYAAFLVAKTQVGVAELAGKAHNKKILEYHQATLLRATADEVPWCSSFVNWCFLIASLIRDKAATIAMLKSRGFSQDVIATFVKSSELVMVELGQANVVLMRSKTTTTPPTFSAMARSFAVHGLKSKGEAGDVAVFSRGNNGVSGHVGFLNSRGNSRDEILGGNQSNRVSYGLYARSRLLGYRSVI